MRVATLALLCLGLVVACASDRPPEEVITGGEVERILTALSADDMLGRRPFTPGIDRAAEYIAGEFEAGGLATLDGLDGYIQQFPAYTLTVDDHRVVLNGREIAGDQCIFAVNDRSIHWETGDDVEVVTVGPDGNSMQAFSAARGREGNTLVVFDERHARFFNRLRSYSSGGRFTMELGGGPNAVYVMANTAAVTSYEIEVTNTVTEAALANVVAVVPGRRTEEMVVFGAHYDHIGVRDAVNGDSIANGANDNATGTTGVIALARYFMGQSRPERTLVFVAFTAEEMGMHGSRYSASQFDPDHVVAMINLEMLGKPELERPNAAWVTGYDRSELGEILSGAVDSTEYLIYADPQPDQNLFMRSDNVSFLRLGIPAHTISTGLLEDDHDYHQVSDEIETLDVHHMTRTIVAIAKAVMPLVSGEATPARIDPAELN